MVIHRSEAKGVPNLLVAPISPTALSTDLYADYVQGYYADGAYTAVPSEVDRSLTKSSERDEDLDPQEAYYAQLCRRFTTLSAILQSSPPGKKSETVSQESVSSLEYPSPSNWRRCILHEKPSMALLGQLRQENIIYGLQILEGALTKGNLLKDNEVGAWAWGLLARCRNVGQMSSEEVGVLRDLAKKSNWIIRGIRAGVGENEEEDQEENDQVDSMSGEGGNDDYSGSRKEMRSEGHNELIEADLRNEPKIINETPAPLDLATTTSQSDPNITATKPSSPNELFDALAEARQQLLKSLHSGLQSESSETSQPAWTHTVNEQTEFINENRPIKNSVEDEVTEPDGNIPPDCENMKEGRKSTMNATLDMIVTIVGEIYGQRDLLDGRLLWDEMQ